MKNYKVLGVTPLEKPDPTLVQALHAAGAYPVLHLGHDREHALAAITELTEKNAFSFGICLVSAAVLTIPLPDQVELLIIPYGLKGLPRLKPGVRIFCQVRSVEEARKAKEAGAHGLIVKGNEGAGLVGEESSFILFQRVRKEVPGIDLWVQGGMGIHTAAAMAAIGAEGIVLDSQLLLFPECQAPSALKELCGKLNGNETRVVEGYRVLVRPNFPEVPMGQDITLAQGLVQRYGKLRRFVFALLEAMHGCLRQAKALEVMAPGNALSKALGLTYPIAQGPMTRVSDVPAFAAAVAEAGALPFVALSLLKGERARQLIRETRQLAGERIWGVGILGFVPAELREEQMAYILEEKPPVVLIAGGRPSQAKPLEQAGIKVFLHVPSATLLDMYIKEGARRFVFEGRECGGHVGPLSSLVLWEKQIERLLQEDPGDTLEVFFAGGIHDAASAAAVAVMAAPLAARGVKVGVLMGTAYLYTREIVETGAIVAGFQEQAVRHQDTVLLETAPGHETRCLRSPFVELFNREKDRLRDAGMDKQEAWAELEKLNVGRLRIAAKGIERDGESLKSISEAEQLASGMYMIGQAAALKEKIVSIEELHKEVTEGSVVLLKEAVLPVLPRRQEGALDIAIIGMACIYPGAKNADTYWQHILSGRDGITEVPSERWNKDLYYDPQSLNGEKSPSKWGGFIPRIDFDPVSFGIPPQSLAAIEPSQLLSLLVAREALEDAGYAGPEVDRDAISVIIGGEGGNDLANSYGFRCLFRQILGEMSAEVDKALPRMTEDSFPGVLANVIAGRISNRLDLGGRNYTVDAACASSLAAVELACQELVLQKSDMVIAGAVDLHNGINDYLLFSSTHALSRTGRCSTFDAAADGIALGEGVAMLVLKRHADAQRDGDRVYAVIRGVGGSSDGRSLGLTAPRKSGQTKALERAYEQAGISPSAVGMIEAHGTGTVVGDKTELSALSDLFQLAGAVPGQTVLGSVKTQIGHTKCAAGMAGLIKAALSVYHGVKPPTLHLKNPNSYYNALTSPFSFYDQAGLWKEKERIAGVSAFGFGGTNFHVVLENVPREAVAQAVLPAWPAELLLFRGDSWEEASSLMGIVRGMIAANDSLELRDIAYSLCCYSDKPVQLSIVAEGVADLSAKIGAALSAEEGNNSEEQRKTNGIYRLKPVEGKVAFLFPGQGSQRVHMARSLFVAFPALRKYLSYLPGSESYLFPAATFDADSLAVLQERVRDTRIAQPLLGIVGLAMAELLQTLGIHPDMAAGHSYGELPALCIAGVIGEKDLIAVSEKRAAAILGAMGEDRGIMAAIQCNQEALTALVEGMEGVYVANHNSPHQWVLAGTTPAMEQLMEKLRSAKVSFKQLDVACAFHSPLLSGAGKLFKQSLEAMEFRAPRIPVWSNTTAAPYPSTAAAIRKRLAEHLEKPVRFSEEVEHLYEEGVRVFIEAGPGKVLSSLTRTIAGKEALVLHTEEAEGIPHLLSVLAAWLASGRALQLEKLFEGRKVRRLELDKPEQYKKSATVWLVNGQSALPAQGALPAHGALPIVQPLAWKESVVAGAHTASVVAGGNGHAVAGSGAAGLGGVPQVPAGNAERMMQEYFDNMKYLIQAQRDVMLGYLGQAPREMQLPVRERERWEEPVRERSRPEEPERRVDPIIGDAGRKNGETMGQEEKKEKIRLSGEEVRDILLKVVSDKTGYPPDMLDLDLDMEADLSIDSIKRMEIVGELRNRLTGILQMGGQEDRAEQLAAIKTLQGLISWVVAALSEQSGPVAEAKKIIEEGFVQAAIQEKLVRLCSGQVADPLKREGIEVLAGACIGVTYDDNKEVGETLQEMLEEYGATVKILSRGESAEGCDGLIILDLYYMEDRLSILESFSLIRGLDPAKTRWVYVVSDYDWHEENEIADLRYFQGYPGFIKSLAKEWESVQCRMIHLNSDDVWERMERILLEELLHKEGSSEVIYDDRGRQTVMWNPTELSVRREADIRLDKESVVLVLGGARGITAELTIRLAQEYPCHYVLVGRSPLPAEESVVPALQEKDAIRQFLISRGESKNPAEIERKAEEIFRHNAVLQTIQTLEAQGAQVSYYSADLRDEKALSTLIDELYSRYGRIDGVVHGAGLLEDKLFHHKTLESFERVFSTKVTPLRVLAEKLRADTQFMVFFSSVASVYGNRGQVDYAAANSVLDQYACELNKKKIGKVLSINWGPWKGAGMVSAALEREYERRGIPLIPLAAGREAFIQELKYGRDGQVLIMAAGPEGADMQGSGFGAK